MSEELMIQVQRGQRERERLKKELADAREENTRLRARVAELEKPAQVRVVLSETQTLTSSNEIGAAVSAAQKRAKRG